MDTVTQTDEQAGSKTARIPEDIWETIRTKAFHERRTMSAILEELLRFALKRKAA